MDRRLNVVTAPVARAHLARLWLGEPGRGVTALGEIVLRPHQRDAIDRLRRTLAEYRVALLADDVGLGKTYIAIALAAEARRPLIVAPAALRAMWQQALHATGVFARWVSYERLSRGDVPLEPADLVILDEAHHARTPSTRRYARLAMLTAGARLLLLSATPIHNRRSDLTILFALGMGEGARTLDDAALAARIVRRTHADVPGESLPALASSEWIRVPDDDAVLQRLLALPPPLPPRGGGDGGALLAWTLVRLWASTRGALSAALRRRAQRGYAIRQALLAGVLPSASELAAWQCSDRAVQLAFAELLAPPAEGIGGLLQAVERHLDAVQSLRGALAGDDGPDRARANALRALRASVPGECIIVFTQFADSAASLWRLLRSDPGVAVLTAKGAHVAGGALSRRDALRRFAPLATGAPQPAAGERITMLICTDLMSEGVNLQDASTVVHLDLPWTHARLAQRVGRVRRMGSPHPAVRVYTFAPPAAAERLLAIERRIGEKLGAAARTLGVAGAILPSMLRVPDDVGEPRARAAERCRALIAGWSAPLPVEPDGLCVASVRTRTPGTLVALRARAGDVRLTALRDGTVSDDPHAVLLLAAAADAAPDAELDRPAIEEALAAVARWARARDAERSAGEGLSIGSRAGRAVLQRLAATVARSTRTRRQETAELAARARRIASSPIGVGGELVLGRLAAAAMPDEAWLRSIAAFAEAHGDAVARGADTAEPAEPVLLIQLLPPPR